MHNVPSIIESPALAITNKIIKKESKQSLEDEVVLIKPIQILPSSGQWLKPEKQIFGHNFGKS